MLGKEFRLTSSRDFLRVKDLGTKYPSKNFLLTVFKRREDVDSPSRFGIVVTTKVFPLAVDRNRIKRVINEATRQNLVYVENGYDCVFLPNQTMLRSYTDEVMKEIKESFHRARITKQTS